jgi:hypothetical protein
MAEGIFGYSPTIFLPKVIILYTDSSKVTEMRLAAWAEGWERKSKKYYSLKYW